MRVAKQGAKCPSCGGSFSKLKDYKCPHCRVGLTLIQVKEGQTTKNRYVLTNPPVEAIPLPEPDHFIFGNITQEKQGDIWQVYVSVLVSQLLCPECGTSAFWFPHFKNGHVSHKCHKCKTTTVFYFKL